MLHIDIKYIETIGSTLNRFTRKNDYLYNFRCPYCGDSKKHQFKARGFFYRKKSDMFYKCHNCGIGKTVSTFLKDRDSSLYKQYKLEKFSKTIVVSTENVYNFETPKFKVGLKSNKYLTLIDNLDNSHVAIKFLQNRKIPLTNELYFTDKFASFIDSLVPGKYPDITQEQKRIIIPFYSREGDLMMLQGRAVESVPYNKRYVTIKIWDDALKVYGLDKIDYKKTIYVVEGPFDSMFLPNCIAMGGGDCDNLSEVIPTDNTIMVYDNEPRNRDTVRRMTKAIAMGYRLFFWSGKIKSKDINDIFLNGMNTEEILEMINKNTFVSFGATLALNQWKRI